MMHYSITNHLKYLNEYPTNSNEHILTIINTQQCLDTIDIIEINAIKQYIPLIKNIHDCHCDVHHDFINGTFMTPLINEYDSSIKFGFLIFKNHLIISDDDNLIESLLEKIKMNTSVNKMTIAYFISHLIELIIIKQSIQLEDIEQELNNLEDKIFLGNLKSINALLKKNRNSISKLIRFYNQLEEVFIEYQENDLNFFTDSDLKQLHRLEKRINRLKSDSISLREYNLQIRELFQAEIDIKQNQTMKVLTVVTTLFLPLTLITGWYGMNFSNMPEIHWKYGYLTVIVISLALVIISLYFMKKKKYW